MGLVLFAGGAYAQMPLTLDYATLSHMARSATSSTLRAQGSDLGAAIDKAVELLEVGQAADRAIIILTDGDSVDAGSPLELIQLGLKCSSGRISRRCSVGVQNDVFGGHRAAEGRVGSTGELYQTPLGFHQTMDSASITVGQRPRRADYRLTVVNAAALHHRQKRVQIE